MATAPHRQHVPAILWSVAFAVIILSAFIPGNAPAVTAGMAALKDTPEWLVVAFWVAFAFAFGMSTLRGVLQARSNLPATPKLATLTVPHREPSSPPLKEP